MVCTICGETLAKNARFCGTCGTAAIAPANETETASADEQTGERATMDGNNARAAQAREQRPAIGHTAAAERAAGATRSARAQPSLKTLAYQSACRRYGQMPNQRMDPRAQTLRRIA